MSNGTTKEDEKARNYAILNIAAEKSSMHDRQVVAK